MCNNSARHLLYVEPRGEPYSSEAAVAFYAYSVTLTGATELSTRWAPCLRHAIRKAEKSGQEARIMNSREAMPECFKNASAVCAGHAAADGDSGVRSAIFSNPHFAVNKWLGRPEYSRLG